MRGGVGISLIHSAHEDKLGRIIWAILKDIATNIPSRNIENIAKLSEKRLSNYSSLPETQSKRSIKNKGIRFITKKLNLTMANKILP